VTWDHGHVNTNRLAFLHAESLQGVGDATHLTQQLRIRDVAHQSRVVALPHHCHLSCSAEGQVNTCINEENRSRSGEEDRR
jgi:hypothetical protein